MQKHAGREEQAGGRVGVRDDDYSSYMPVRTGRGIRTRYTYRCGMIIIFYPPKDTLVRIPGTLLSIEY